MKKRILATILLLSLSYSHASICGTAGNTSLARILTLAKNITARGAKSFYHSNFFSPVFSAFISICIESAVNYLGLTGTSAYKQAIQAQGQLLLNPLHAPATEKENLATSMRLLIKPLKKQIHDYTPDPGFLLVGNINEAKTTIKAIAAFLKTPYIFESAPGLVGANTGSGAASITRLYQRAEQSYNSRRLWTRLKNPLLWFRKPVTPPTLAVVHDISQLCTDDPTRTEYHGARKNFQTIIDGAFATDQPQKVFWIATIEEDDLRNMHPAIREPLIRSQRLKCLRLNGEAV